jgi:hypothetical protein
MVQVASSDLPAGVTLTRSALGGFRVDRRGEFIGWIHENGPDRWNAYRRAEPPKPGQFLGAFSQTDAVQRIAHAIGGADQKAPAG